MPIRSRALKGALAISLALAFVFAVGVMRAPRAHAYGPLALWQVGLSFNCDNPALCSSLGGFWGWAEFDSDATADAQLTGCEHLQGGRAGGASHFSDNATWTTVPGQPDFFLTSEMITFTGRTGGPPVTITIPSESFDTGIPASAGHFSAQTLFGMQAPPGTNFEIQVTQLNH